MMTMTHTNTTIHTTSLLNSLKTHQQPHTQTEGASLTFIQKKQPFNHKVFIFWEKMNRKSTKWGKKLYINNLNLEVELHRPRALTLFCSKSVWIPTCWMALSSLNLLLYEVKEIIVLHLQRSLYFFSFFLSLGPKNWWMVMLLIA